jgi:hypothetical protein
MSQAEDLLRAGLAHQQEQLGEEITFRGVTFTATVASRDPEMNLEEGGWSTDQTFAVTFDMRVIHPAPRNLERIRIRGIDCTIATVQKPSTRFPAWQVVARANNEQL